MATQSRTMAESPTATAATGITTRDSGISLAAMDRNAIAVAAAKHKKPPSWGHQFVMTEENMFRRCWTIVLLVLLIYTGTIFPLNLCFYEFGMPAVIEIVGVWAVIDTSVDILFWVDLVVSFFFSFTDIHKTEVVDLILIARQYFFGMFWLNLIACLPPSLFSWLIGLAFHTSSGDSAAVNQTPRMLRVSRISRLVRLARLTRLTRLTRFIHRSPLVKRLRNAREMRILTLIVALVWIVHLIGCGWFLCASAHQDGSETWVARRGTTADGSRTLIDEHPLLQWMHSFYFVLTVFTTVGFGDMSAMTSGEILYVSWTMVCGAVVNSVIVGEVINVVTSSNRQQIQMRKQKELIDAFCAHTDLDEVITSQMSSWVESQSASFDYDDEGMRRLLTSGRLPRVLLSKLPQEMFGGLLMKNHFVTTCLIQVRQLPPRFAVLLALKVFQRHFAAHEFVYHYNDHPFNLFLVKGGVFAHVAKVNERCGYQEVPKEVAIVHEEHSSVWTKLNGVLAPTGNDPNEVQLGYNAAVSAVLFPYKLLGMYSCFGINELLEGKPRQSTVRCEDAKGVLFGFPKQEFFDLMREYPHFARAWTAQARRHELLHFKLMKSMNVNNRAENHRILAVTIMVNALRRFKRLRSLRRDLMEQDPNADVGVRLRPSQHRLADAATCMQHQNSIASAESGVRSLRAAGSEVPSVQVADLRKEMTANIGALAGQVNELKSSIDEIKSILTRAVVSTGATDTRILKMRNSL